VRTFSPKPADITRAWHIVDADGLVLGRLATEVASVLRGKHKPTFAPNADMGDHVIVVNADKIVMTSGKAESKMAYRHSGYPGGLTATSYSHLLVDRADDVVRNAITGMLPKNRLGRQMATKLKVYRGAEHPHVAQSPEPLELPGARRTASARSGA
jgi:large subunit ribosomal protein L13